MLSCFFCGICIIICRVGAAVGVLSFSFDPVGEQRRLSSTFSYVLLCFAVVLAWRWWRLSVAGSVGVPTCIPSTYLVLVLILLDLACLLRAVCIAVAISIGVTVCIAITVSIAVTVCICVNVRICICISICINIGVYVFICVALEWIAERSLILVSVKIVNGRNPDCVSGSHCWEKCHSYNPVANPKHSNYYITKAYITNHTINKYHRFPLLTPEYPHCSQTSPEEVCLCSSWRASRGWSPEEVFCASRSGPAITTRLAPWLATEAQAQREAKG